MRKLTVVIVSLLVAVPALAQTVDFSFSSTVDAAYEAYVDSMQAEFAAAIDTVADSTTMWGHMGLVMTAIANIQIDGGDMVDDIQVMVDDLASQIDSVNYLVDSVIILDGSDFIPFIQSLTEHFLDPTYMRIKKLTDGTSRTVMSDVDSIQVLVQDYGSVIQDWFIQLEDNADALVAGSTFVEFSYQIDSDSVITLDTAIMAQLDDITRLAYDIGTELENAVNAVMTAADTTDSAVVRLQEATGFLRVMADSIDVLFAVELIDTLLADNNLTREIRRVADDADSILAGEEYTLDDDTTKTIRPVAILENLNADWGMELEYLLRSDMPETLTFFGLFPAGLPQPWLDGLEVNLVIDVGASEAQVDSYLTVKQAEFEAALVLDDMDAVAHTGLALIKTYRLIDVHSMELEELVDFFNRGFIDSLTAKHTWESIDYTAETDDIQYHFDMASQSDDLLFIVVWKEVPWNLTLPASFDIRPEDDIVGVSPVVDEFIQLGADIIAELVRARDNFSRELQTLFDELHTYMDMDLDPNVMDFSNTVHDTDRVDILIAANPNFLELTPLGVAEFTARRQEIRDQLARYADATAEIKNLLNAVATRSRDLELDSLGIDSLGLVDFGHNLDSMVNEIKRDFDDPAYAVTIDSERVNLSAWFDNPPDSLIYRIRAGVDEDSLSDNTIGGLFPDRGVGNYLTGIARPWLKYRPLRSVVKHVGGNPVQSKLTLRVEVSKQAPVSVAFTDAVGTVVRAVNEGVQPAGVRDFSYTLDGMRPGTYFVTVDVGGTVTAYKLVLLK